MVQYAQTLVQQGQTDTKDSLQQAQTLVQEARMNLEIGTHGDMLRMMLEEQREMLAAIDTRMRALEAQNQEIKQYTNKKMN